MTSDADAWDCFAAFKDVDYSDAGGDPVDGGVQVSYRAEVTTKSGPLNIRTGPGTEYPVKARVRKGEIVDVWMEYPNGWDFIDDDGQTGYASASYLTRIDEGTSQPPAGGSSPDEGSQGASTILRRRSDGATIAIEGEWMIMTGDD